MEVSLVLYFLYTCIDNRIGCIGCKAGYFAFCLCILVSYGGKSDLLQSFIYTTEICEHNSCIGKKKLVFVVLLCFNMCLFVCIYLFGEQIIDLYNLLQAIGEEEAQRPLVDSSFNRAFISDPIGTVLTPSSQQYGIPRNVDLTQSTSSHLQLDEAPEVTSASNITEQERGLSEEDFLEIDDLLVPETVPTPRIDEKAEDLQSKDDGLWLLDLYDDTVKFLRETVPLPYLNTIENEMVNRVDNQIQPHSAGVEQISSELWTLDQGSVYSPSDSIQGTIGQPTSGTYICQDLSVYSSPWQ